MSNITKSDNKLQQKNSSNTSFKSLNQRIISIFPIYIDITGSITRGYLLSQITWLANYWRDKNDNGSDIFYKTDKEFQKEMRMGSKEFKNAKKILQELGFIKVVIQGIPATSYYEVNWEKIEEVINDFNNLPKNNKKEKSLTHCNSCGGAKGTNYVVQKEPTTQYIEIDIINKNNTNPYIPLKSEEKKEEEKQPSSLSLLDSEEKKLKENYEEEFLEFWKEYPKSKEKNKTFDEYRKARKRKTSHEEIMVGVKNYLLSIQLEKTEQKYIKYSHRWLRDERWKDEFDTKNLTNDQKKIIFDATGNPDFKPKKVLFPSEWTD